jgi:hypothetical protein
MSKNVTAGWRICPACHRVLPVNSDGRMAVHGPDLEPGSFWLCHGSGQLPAGPPFDGKGQVDVERKESA